MQWINLYGPKNLSECYFHKNEMDECIQWMNDYKKDFTKTKKVLMIIGHTGAGKTKLAQLLLQEFNYQIIEYNSSDTRSQKKITEVIKKTLAFRNVIDMFNDNKKPLGIIMDEIDTICKTGDKGGFSEFLNIIKMNDKYESYLKDIENNKKKKSLSKTNTDDFIKLYNPIICTTNDINDKKINELKKFSKVIYLKKDLSNEMKILIKDIFLKNNLTISDEAIDEITKISGNDIRRLFIYLEDIYYAFKANSINSNILNIDFIKKYNNVDSCKNMDLQLIEATHHIFYKTNSFYDNQLLFDIDCLLLPLMVYHNSLLVIKKSKDDPKKKLNIYKEMLYSLCIHDTIQTNIFEIQEWNDFYDISSLYGSVLPNYYSTLLSDYKENQVELQFTNLLNKISQMFVNKKLVNSAKYGLNKIDLDLDELIYIVEIISSFLNEFKNIGEDDDDGDEEDEDIQENVNYFNKSLDINKDINKVKNLDNAPMIAKMMNKYKISVDSLETILKIEKLNQNNDVKKRKFTITLKKEIQKFILF
jgi:energy-coupling factor transporter ATP-binding protein EcfA2